MLLLEDDDADDDGCGGEVVDETVSIMNIKVTSYRNATSNPAKIWLFHFARWRYKSRANLGTDSEHLFYEI